MSPSETSPTLAIVVCCLGVLVIGINSTAIMTALPVIRHDLGLGATEAVWAVNAYLLAAAAGVMGGGAAGSRFGAVRTTRVGLLVFGLASAVIATASGSSQLLAGRVLQGIGASLAVPGTLTAVSAASPRACSMAVGAWAGCLLLGFSLGPVLGGALTHLVTWRAIFGLDGSAALVAAACLLTVRETAPGRPQGSFDGPGLALLALAMVAVIRTLQSLSVLERTPMGPIAWLALAAASLGLLWRRERACADPLICPDLIATRGLRPAIVVGAAAMFCILPLLMTFNLFAQAAGGLGLTPIQAGLALLPMSASLIGSALAAPRLIRAFGTRRTVTAGFALVLLGSGTIALATDHGVLAALSGGLFLSGAGLALPYATAPRLALAAAPAQAGQASGFLNACTLLAGSAGVTLCSLAYQRDGLPLAMGVLTLAALVGFVGCRWLPPAEGHRSSLQASPSTVGPHHEPEALP